MSVYDSAPTQRGPGGGWRALPGRVGLTQKNFFSKKCLFWKKK